MKQLSQIFSNSKKEVIKLNCNIDLQCNLWKYIISCPADAKTLAIVQMIDLHKHLE